ncbi:MAG: glycosyltransferase, partial [Acidimicrobiia bacterium]|nr:glycosyltransferase [Acidimicrobiia bacterium]
MWLIAPENDYRSILDLQAPDPQLRVTVCMPVYNRVDLLARTVAALAAQSYPRELMSVSIGDDGSDEDVAAAVAPFSGRLDITVSRRERDGYGAGQARNLAARNSAGDILVFVDSDCLPDPDLVLNHAVWHHLAENLVVIGSRHGVDTSGFDLDALARGSAPLRELAFGTAEPGPKQLSQTDYRGVLHRRTADGRHGDEAFRSLVSSNFSIRRDRFFEIGGFDESFHRWGGEDIELGWRCHVAGLFTVPDDRAVCYHQLQEDLWDAGGREDSAKLNAGVIQNKIPHHFYRRYRRGLIRGVPKVSVVVTPEVPARIEELADHFLSQSYADWELIAHGTSPETILFSER